MATLTAGLISKIRRLIGDSNPDNKGSYDLTDNDIQIAYDEANSDLWLAAVDLLEQRLGLWSNEIDTMTLDGAGQKRQQKYNNIKHLLEYARKQAGLTQYVLRIGSLDEGLTQDEH